MPLPSSTSVQTELTPGSSVPPCEPAEPTPLGDPEQANSGKEVVEFNEQTNYVPRRQIITIFLACASVDMIALIDQTTLAVSLSIIGSALRAGSQQSWIANAYFLTSTSFQLLYGRLSDIWSRKLVLLSGLLVFFLGSLAASLAQTTPQIIVFRAITGVGGGGLMTIAQIIVSDVVTLRERGKYQGILGAVVALSNGVGPLIGGALASQSEDSWRWIFRINLPLTAFTTLCVLFFMPLQKVEGSWQKKLKVVDFFGAGLTLGGSTLIILGLTWAGGQYPWSSVYVITPIVVGVFVSFLFIVWQWKGTKYPLMPVYIFKRRMVNGACLSMFINGWIFVVQVYYIPTFYQIAYGYSAVRAGALLLPLVLVQTLSSTLSGLIVTWRGRYRESILAGWLLWAAGLGLFSTLDETSGLEKQIGYAILMGFGVGQTLQPSLVAIQAGVPRRDMAVVTGTRNFVRNLGGTVGLAVAGTIINNTLRISLGRLSSDNELIRQILEEPSTTLDGSRGDEAFQAAVLAGYRQGFRIIFLVAASLAAFAFVVVLFLMPELGLDRSNDQELKEEAKRRIQGEKETKAARKRKDDTELASPGNQTEG